VSSEYYLHISWVNTAVSCLVRVTEYAVQTQAGTRIVMKDFGCRVPASELFKRKDNYVAHSSLIIHNHHTTCHSKQCNLSS
jgi:hypothetical protein